MLELLIIVLLVAWLLGVFVVGQAFFHLLLIVGVVLVLVRLLQGRSL